MKLLLITTLLFLALSLIVRAEAAPEDVWRQGSPESQGFSPAKLEALRAELIARKTRGLLIIRNDTIVCEWYAPGQGRNTRFGTASLAKALIGGVSYAVAMTDGRIDVDDPAAKFIPQWRDDPRKSRITLRQLGSHTAGVEDAEADEKPHTQLTGWKGDFWKHLPVPDDPFTISRDRAPLVFEPGAEMRYSNPGIALLTYCVTASLRDTPEKDIRSLLRDRVLRPIGVPDAEWSAGYGKTSTVDSLPLVGSWGGATFTARAAARVRPANAEGRRLGRRANPQRPVCTAHNLGRRYARPVRHRLVEQQRGRLRKAAPRRIFRLRGRTPDSAGDPEFESNPGAFRSDTRRDCSQPKGIS